MTTAIPTSGAPTEPGFDTEAVEQGFDGPPLSRVTLRNGRGMEMVVFNRGGIIQSLIVPDRDGLLADVTLGFDTIDEYAGDTNYFGALVGRYANRIAGGRFEIDGVEYQLPRNNGNNHLHGGPSGFHTREWNATPFVRDNVVSVLLERTSVDGEEGYPGALDVSVTYSLTPVGELICDYHAVTTKPTPVNLTQHSYWNLAGHDVGDVLDHELQLNASHYTPVDPELIPLGTHRAVEGTAFDFRRLRTVGSCIDEQDEQLRIAHGYDHNFVRDQSADAFRHAAQLIEPASGRVMDVFTTEPGIQLYTGNMIQKDVPGKGGARYRRHSGLCLETQHFPDSPNRSDFPNTILYPGEEYRSRTVFRFSVQT